MYALVAAEFFEIVFTRKIEVRTHKIVANSMTRLSSQKKSHNPWDEGIWHGIYPAYNLVDHII